MPNVMKIGMTSREMIDARMKELFNTSMFRFRLSGEYACKVASADKSVMMSFAPLVTDMYLPSLPALTDRIDTSASMIQMTTLTSMLVSMVIYFL
jgi:hypothetical protein